MIPKNNPFSLYNITFQNSYVCTYVNTVTITKKRGFGFKGEQRGIYGKVWRKEKDDGNGFKL